MKLHSKTSIEAQYKRTNKQKIWVSSEIFDNNADTTLELKITASFLYLTVRKINMFSDKLIFVYQSNKCILDVLLHKKTNWCIFASLLKHKTGTHLYI